MGHTPEIAERLEAAQKLPAGHEEHADDAAAAENEPPGQAWHAEAWLAPVLGWYAPTAQLRQLEAPVLTW